MKINSWCLHQRIHWSCLQTIRLVMISESSDVGTQLFDTITIF